VEIAMGSDAVTCRVATAADWPDIASLLAELGRPDVRRDPRQAAAGLASLERYLAREDAVALVAEADGTVVGFLDIEFRSWLNYMTPDAWIPDFIVTGQMRGQGIGGLLLARAEELARERQCWSMALESANWRTRAHKFYKSHGWEPTAKHFRKALADIAVPDPSADRPTVR
jgi:GNAT superfamily N-acetyltransferase